MKHIALAAPMGKRHDQQCVDAAAKQLTQLANPFVVGAVSATHGESPFVDPRNVTALDRARGGDGADNRHAKLAQRSLLRTGLALSSRFSHVAEDRAFVTYNCGVANV